MATPRRCRARSSPRPAGTPSSCAPRSVWLPPDDAGLVRLVTRTAAREVELVRGQRLALRCTVDARGAAIVS